MIKIEPFTFMIKKNFFLQVFYLFQLPEVYERREKVTKNIILLSFYTAIVEYVNT